MARPVITAVDVDRLHEDGTAEAITIRTDQGHATHIDFADGIKAYEKMYTVCATVGLERVGDTDDLVGRRLMTSDEVAAWRKSLYPELADLGVWM